MLGDRTRSGLEHIELCWSGYSPGIGIVHENANSVAVKLTFWRGKELSVGGKKLGVQNEKKEAPVLAPLQIPMKHWECVHTWLLPVLVTLIVNTAAGCYSHGQALALNTVTPTCFSAMFWQRKHILKVKVWKIYHVCPSSCQPWWKVWWLQLCK